MIKTEERINPDALAFNLIILCEITEKNRKYNRRFGGFLRKHSLKNQLPITVTIFY